MAGAGTGAAVALGVGGAALAIALAGNALKWWSIPNPFGAPPSRATLAQQQAQARVAEEAERRAMATNGTGPGPAPSGATARWGAGAGYAGGTAPKGYDVGGSGYTQNRYAAATSGRREQPHSRRRQYSAALPGARV